VDYDISTLMVILLLPVDYDISNFQQYFSYIVVSVLLVDETGGPGENNRPAASH
jgi:hypothetical protein